ncbi:plasmid transfer protein TraA [Kitasatospora kifunensis]|uniref:Sporulation protein SsgA n=1 Tax=Kitasatospora kifunensis TaxID=58351 RepID=A0A7W7VWR0_KITKI|nr:plasmid transfer protein TraA [Kitasatospora kifunensis]MBB4924780.1 hypothetical protein [Kitasatospora kifunensis]
MSTPTNNFRSGNSGARPSGAGQQQARQGGNGAAGNSYHFHYSRAKTNVRGNGQATGAGQGAGIGRGQTSGGGGQQGGRTYSPLADADFFTNADVRNYCERGRAILAQASFDLAMAYEVLSAVLKEVPDPDGRPFGSQARARRVARNLKKAADDAKDCAAHIARTYAAFQREYDPELSRVARPRQAPRRNFNFND